MLWGAPAVEADDTVDPAIAAVAEIIGAEARMRTADQQLNDAAILMSQAQKAIAENQDETRVADLVYGIFFTTDTAANPPVPSLYDDVLAKETKKHRELAYFDALYQDIRKLELAREAAW